MDDEGLTQNEWLQEIAATLEAPKPPEGYFSVMELAEAAGIEDKDKYRKRLYSAVKRGEFALWRARGRVWFKKLDKNVQDD